jgi:hypothetical protein
VENNVVSGPFTEAPAASIPRFAGPRDGNAGAARLAEQLSCHRNIGDSIPCADTFTERAAEKIIEFDDVSCFSIF